STSPRVRQGYRICQAICEFRLRAMATDKPLAPYLPLKRGGRRAQRGGGGSKKRGEKDPHPVRLADRPPPFQGRWSKQHCRASINGRAICDSPTARGERWSKRLGRAGTHRSKSRVYDGS